MFLVCFPVLLFSIIRFVQCLHLSKTEPMVAVILSGTIRNHDSSPSLAIVALGCIEHQRLILVFARTNDGQFMIARERQGEQQNCFVSVFGFGKESRFENISLDKEWIEWNAILDTEITREDTTENIDKQTEECAIDDLFYRYLQFVRTFNLWTRFTWSTIARILFTNFKTTFTLLSLCSLTIMGLGIALQMFLQRHENKKMLVAMQALQHKYQQRLQQACQTIIAREMMETGTGILLLFETKTN